MLRRILVLVCLAGVVCPAGVVRADAGALLVDESLVRAEIGSNGAVKIALPVRNGSASAVSVRVRAELIDPANDVVGTGERTVRLTPGANSPALVVARERIAEWDADDIVSTRVRYRITPESAAMPAAAGIVALSAIARDVFELTASTARDFRPGRPLRVTVAARRPLGGPPVAGVALEATLELSGGDHDFQRTTTARTGKNGTATITFDVPAAVDADDGKITVTGRLGGFTNSVESDLDAGGREAKLLVTTDKGIYQPDQTLHMRCLAFDSAKRAIVQGELAFKVENPAGETVFEGSATTSRFGVASLDWQIPASAPLGPYLVEVEIDDSDTFEGQGITGVWISRYDLPNFAVTTEPDRPYYLPGEDAKVAVRADYLFGKPVPHARVRVVRQGGGHWNYQTHKWEVDEGEAYEAETGADGAASVAIPLAAAHEELADNDYNRFTDLGFAAYATDPSTNRTEQRRFVLRITRDPIHVYVVTPDPIGPGTAADVYVATSYADGTPASCDVAVHGQLSPVDLTVHTNRYGVARIRDIVLGEDASNERDTSLTFEARDAAGRRGQHVESLWFDGEPTIQVRTDKVFYAPGEPILADIRSSAREAVVFVDVRAGDAVVDSRAVRLRDGHATLAFPYRAAMRGAVTVAATTNSEGDGYYGRDTSSSARRVLYPSPSEVEVTVRGAKETYRPGDSVSAELRLRDSEGRAVEGVFGVAVVDRAVEERERTDSEFSGMGFYSGYDWYRGYDVQVGGLTLRDLEQVDATRSVPRDLALAAELLLLSGASDAPTLMEADRFEANLGETFKSHFAPAVEAVRKALIATAGENVLLPSNDAELASRLAAGGGRLADWLDPWGTPLGARFSIDKVNRVVEIVSAGPDEQFGTHDDFAVDRLALPYFTPTGSAINAAVERWQTRTGRYVRGETDLRSALAEAGIGREALVDPWGTPYRIEFGITRGTQYTIQLKSNGPDKRPEPESWRSDDFTVWTTWTDTFRATRTRIDEILANDELTPEFPRDDKALGEALARGGLDLAALRDLWGHALFTRYSRDAQYVDRAVVRQVQKYGEPASQRTDTTPVTATLDSLEIWSAGEDGEAGTYDDVRIASFGRVIAEQSSADAAPKPVVRPVLAGSTGAISGTVVDPQGAIVQGATVSAVEAHTGATYSTITNESGKFLLRNLPPSLYTVRVDASGFMAAVVTDVTVRSSTVTSIDFTLTAAGTAESVTVVSGEQSVQVSTSSSAATTVRRGLGATVRVQTEVSTPRVRQYFPETLYWQPSLETDRGGRAKIDFALADSITTWKLSVFASTADGRIARTDAELLAFQPFFVDHDPPKVLTEGDRIELPVVVRNYTDKIEQVDVEMRPEAWFAISGPARRVTVAPGEPARPTFDIRAVSEVDAGPQRVTATGAHMGDAIEKPVSVHPDGDERADTTTRVFSNDVALDAAIPDDALGAPHAELKIYPNLFAHVTESVEAILERPYGCGEQTVSSTYPSVILLRRAKDRIDPKLAEKAERYASLGVDRLLGYRMSDGGFSYWGHGDSNLALTAYALRFLTDAREVVPVDDQLLDGARKYLLTTQKDDGSWESTMTTAYVVRVLAALGGDDATKAAVARALAFVGRKARESDEPYTIACYAMACMDAGASDEAAWAIARLEALAHEEGDGSYWTLETNTPFYGWGRAGRIETTALAVQALERAGSTALADRGLIFLLRNKDRYGVWYSTQATINVLDSILATLATRTATGDRAGTTSFEVLLDGQRIATAEAPPPQKASGPIRIELPRPLARGAHRVDVRRAGSTEPATVQLVTSYYVPWKTPVPPGAKRTEATANGMRLAVSYDRVEAAINEPISCTVEAERIGLRGYGMLLGEIGLPPGAEVDRESLERAVESSGWGLSHYDVLPDRVVVYLWPRAGGQTFTFAFRCRYAIDARTAPSTLYDYYNPDAAVVVGPGKVVVSSQ